jgi:c-di-GMP-related signal transduction protein
MQTHTVLHNPIDDRLKIFIGRQPILDSKLKVVGYELLFRSSNVDAFDGSDDNKATSQVINNALLEIGLDDIIGNKPAFINFSKDLLINGVVELLPPERVVLEILETVKVDDELVAGVKALVDGGYKIALDDFTFSEEWIPLIELAHIIKFDVMAFSVEEIKEQTMKFAGRNIKFLAEKVETQDEYNQFKELGFDYFQGYFFSKPDIISHQGLSPDNISLLQLIAQLQKPDTEIDEIEKLISQNVSLSYKLFRCINSAAFGLKNKMTSIKQAVVYLGNQRLKNWACLLAMTGNSNKPEELIQVGLVRAKMCEFIADEIEASEKDSFFVVGLFSILDAMLDQPLANILNKIPLDDSLNKALLEGTGEMGLALRCSLCCEQCIWDEIQFPNISRERLFEFHQDAMIWARQTMSELH